MESRASGRVAVQPEAFMLLTIAPTVQYDVSIQLAREQVHPAFDGASHEIEALLV